MKALESCTQFENLAIRDGFSNLRTCLRTTLTRRKGIPTQQPSYGNRDSAQWVTKQFAEG